MLSRSAQLGQRLCKERMAKGLLLQQGGKTVQRHLSTRSSVLNPADTAMSGANAAYVEMQYLQWKKDPASVHASWDAFFRTGAYVAPPTLQADASQKMIPSTPVDASAPGLGGAGGAVDADLVKVVSLIRAFQKNGHLIAKIDPLEMKQSRLGGTETHPELTLEGHGFTQADLNKKFNLGLFRREGGFLAAENSLTMTLQEIYNTLLATYSSTIGYEYEHLDNQDEIAWLRNKIETPHEPLSKEEKLKVYAQMVLANRLENFLNVKFNTKRFGLEGGEATIPALRQILMTSSQFGVQSTVMGMAHRGRLNVLTNIANKPFDVLFAEFQDYSDAGSALVQENGSFDIERDEQISAGDVKYHQGWSSVQTLDNGKPMHVTLLPNPSHLEVVNPVVMGKTRAKQDFAGDFNREKVMSILLHGDASFAGQGVVYESMTLHGLPDYNIGGTLHIVINNQVGFTTDPENSRSGPYCSDIAKTFRAPVFHVNGDDVEAVVRAAKIAAEFRAKFKRDVVIDLVCFRFNGHNEMDNPFFTQPLMYTKVKELFNKQGIASSIQKYQAQLIQEGVLTQAQVDAIFESVGAELRAAFESAKKILAGESAEHRGPNATQHCTGQWAGMQDMTAEAKSEPTFVAHNILKELGRKISTIPADIKLQKPVADAYKLKAASIENESGIDWATAEGLAFASLLQEGVPVRLAGQDAQRGTFSHRHAVVHCGQTGKTYSPYEHLEAPAKLTVVNSPLSELAAMGFEYGYSLDHPNQLVLWEAQFGDFVNGAQIMLDNFLSSGDHKWLKQSGLTLLLPHGYEGQGAEHSSARMERFLQMANDDPTDFPDGEAQSNLRVQRATWQVVNCTTSANYFHALRRQVKRNFRKPLVVFTPKVSHHLLCFACCL